VPRKLMNAQPLVLHHYTSGTGLLGIFDSDSVWASLIHSQNDTKEFEHAIDEARTYLSTLRAADADAAHMAINLALSTSLDRIARLNIYVACFSAIEDSLSQWRGYCPPGFGYSLGLFGEELERVAGPQGFRLVKCIYDHAEQRPIIEQWAEYALQELRKTLPAGADPVQHVNDKCPLFFPGFAAFAPTMKDQAFRDECEWRLVGIVPPNDRRGRVRG